VPAPFHLPGGLNTAIDDLTSAQKEVLILRYWKCLTMKQIAAIIGVSDDSVKDRLNGAKNALKKKMKVF
jgi:RNA polymerase sigma factor (sigma-70 family)